MAFSMGLQKACCPRAELPASGIGRGNAGYLADGCILTIIRDGDSIQHLAFGPACPDGAETELPSTSRGLFHFTGKFLNTRSRVSASFTIVPTCSPITTRRIFSGSFSANKTMGIWLSMDSDVAVESITIRCRARISS